MSSLNASLLKRLTNLSRIHCSEEEQESLLKSLSQILEYMQQLEEVDTENVPSCNHVLEGHVNVMRDDTTGTNLTQESFFTNVAEHRDGLIKVPPVIRKSD